MLKHFIDKISVFQYNFKVVQNVVITSSFLCYKVWYAVKLSLQIRLSCSSHYNFNQPFIFHNMKMWSCIFLRLVLVFVAKILLQKAFFNRDVSHFKGKLSSTDVWTENTWSCRGGGPWQGHYFNALLPSSLAFATGKMFLKIVCRLNNQ